MYNMMRVACCTNKTNIFLATPEYPYAREHIEVLIVLEYSEYKISGTVFLRSSVDTRTLSQQLAVYLLTLIPDYTQSIKTIIINLSL